jgi:serine/threonine protein kinase
MQAGPYNPLTTEQPGKPAPAGALREGEVVDRYVVVGWLGEGGVASVFRVRHTTLNTAYAIKLLKIPRPDLRERLLREGRLQAALQHPNIVRVHDVLTIHGSPALVLDLVEGPSLRQELERGPLAAPALLTIARSLAAALVHAHARGVVHRDLKPANILLTHLPGGPQPHITDFGIARLLEATPEAGATLTGGILGTMAYMAPEQLRCSRDVGCAADMFSLGVILYELACGERPFAAADGDPVAMAEAISAQRYAPLEARRPDLHPTFYEAVAGCLRDAASERPIASAALGLLTPPPAQLVAAPPAPLARRVTPSFVGALALTLALGGGAGALIQRGAAPVATQPAPPTKPAPEDSAQRDALEAARLEAAAWRMARKDAGHALALLRAAAKLAPAEAPRAQACRCCRRRRRSTPSRSTPLAKPSSSAPTAARSSCGTRGPASGAG